MSDDLICPVCESEDIQIEKLSQSHSYAYGGEFVFDQTLHVCQDCGEKGSFSNQLIEDNHETFSVALKEADRESLESIFEDLSIKGNSLAYIERSLGLAQRTLSRWKSQGASASGMALMRVVRTYPWILKVADENFDNGIALEELTRNAVKSFYETMSSAGFRAHQPKILSQGDEVHILAGWVSGQSGESRETISEEAEEEEMVEYHLSGPSSQPKTLA
jgi:hypothetical protein